MPFKRSNYPKKAPAYKHFNRHQQQRMVDAAARAIQARMRAISKGRKVRRQGRAGPNGGLLMGGRYRTRATNAQFNYK